jgi:hypothetical protein
MTDSPAAGVQDSVSLKLRLRVKDAELLWLVK